MRMKPRQSSRSASGPVQEPTVREGGKAVLAIGKPVARGVSAGSAAFANSRSRVRFTQVLPEFTRGGTMSDADRRQGLPFRACSLRHWGATMRGGLRVTQEMNARSGMKFEIVSELRGIETIASGRQIRVLALLRKKWGLGRWRKMKGFARVRILRTGHIRDVEIHWYEAHGIGRKDFKIKKLLK